MEKLTAKQTASDLTEAEAIKQAKEGDAAAFEFLTRRIAGASTACAYA